MLSIISIILRVLFILFAIIVLSLSATFMKDQEHGQSPRTTQYSVFVGAFGMVVGAVGLVALWVDKIPSMALIVADVLAALLFLAGGIAWAVGMKGQSCSMSSLQDLYLNPLLNQGCNPVKNGPGSLPYCAVAGQQGTDPWPLLNLWPSPLKGICQKAVANETFQFLGFVAAAVLVVLGFLMTKKRGSKPSFAA